MDAKYYKVTRNTSRSQEILGGSSEAWRRLQGKRLEYKGFLGLTAPENLPYGHLQTPEGVHWRILHQNLKPFSGIYNERKAR